MLENWPNNFGKDGCYNHSEIEESQNIVLYLKNICISELLGTNTELLQPSTRKHVENVHYGDGHVYIKASSCTQNKPCVIPQ